ncbi:MAG: NAD(P)H-dependent oxidoreductase [bacterium]|nr:NAD(P)H-dependent oxidoreductase [bacterium]
MNVLIVYAHPDPRSFQGVMKDHAVATLVERGHAVQVTDLYAMGFEAAAGPGDFTHGLGDAPFDLQNEQLYAAQNNTFSPELVTEQQKVLWADCLLLQCPLWWYSVPAILKGWIDRVLAYGFAYGQGHSLTGRRAMVVLTTGGPYRVYTPEMRTALVDLLDPLLRGTLFVCGFRVLPPFAVYGAASATSEQRNEALRQYTELLNTLERILPINYSAG